MLVGELEDGGICGTALKLRRYSRMKGRNKNSGVLTVIELSEVPFWTCLKTIKNRPIQCQSWRMTGIT